VTRAWTKDCDWAYRWEVERLFRERTPPAQGDIYSIDSAGRVTRSEMRAFSQRVLLRDPPETDARWVACHAKWYQKMSLRVRREMGEIT